MSGVWRNQIIDRIGTWAYFAIAMVSSVVAVLRRNVSGLYAQSYVGKITYSACQGYEVPRVDSVRNACGVGLELYFEKCIEVCVWNRNDLIWHLSQISRLKY